MYDAYKRWFMYMLCLYVFIYETGVYQPARGNLPSRTVPSACSIYNDLLAIFMPPVCGTIILS